MKGKIIDRIVSILLIFIMTFSYWGILANKVYAEYELEEQKVKTNNKNVEFDVYLGNDNEKVHEVDIDKENQGNLYLNFNVSKGYLKQISVKIDNPNFILSSEDIEIDGTEILLAQVDDQEEIQIPFNFEKQELIDSDYFSRETRVELTAIYVDDEGEENEIVAERKIKVNWQEEVTINSKQEIEKVISLGSGRAILQTNLKIQIEENQIPVENTKIEIQNPVIENVEIEDAKIYAVKTIQANGIEDGTGFTKDNWEYNKDESKIIVNVENSKTEDNKISWKDGEDEFKIIYILNSQEDIENKIVKLQANGELSYNGNNIPFESIEEHPIVFEGNLIDTNYLATESINKGYMYANTEYETAFATRLDIETSYADLIDTMNIKLLADDYVLENGKVVSGKNNIVFKSLVINKTNFETLFGEEGKLEIFSNGNKISEVNKESETDESGNIVVNCENEESSIEIVASKPIAEGKLEIHSIKKVKAQTGYGTEEVKSLKEIISKAEIKTNVTEDVKEARIKLNETVTKAELTMLTDTLSTVVKNESVEMRVLFRTDSNMYDLYKNPNIEIELPRQIQEVNLNSIEAAFGDGFTLGSYEIVQNEQGNKIIKIGLNGEQTKYAIDISEGMSLVIKADMAMDKKTGSSIEKVILRYANEKAIGYDNNGIAEAEVKIEAPTGVVAINSISNYNVGGDTATSLSSKEQTGELEILTDKKIATMTIDVINNHGKEIINPSIIGRVPYEGNKKETGEELGSTFTAAVVRGIEKQVGLENANYKVYYSSNGEATEDISNTENGWTENIEEAGEIKSYLIQAEGYSMAQGETMSFNYEVEIPEGLNHNESAYGTYAVNYEIEEQGTTREEQVVAPTVGTTTGAGPVLEVSLEANVENGAEVESDVTIDYTVNIKNVGSVDAKNVVIKTDLPKNCIFMSSTPEGVVEELIENIIDEETGVTSKENKFILVITQENIAVGETSSVVIRLKPEMNEDVDNQTIEVESKITADNFGATLTTNRYVNKVIKGNITLELDSIYAEKDQLTEGETFYLTGVIRNVNDEKNNLVMKYVIPEGLEYTDVVIRYKDKEYREGITYDKNTRTLIVKLDKVEAYEVVSVRIDVIVSGFEDGMHGRTMIRKISAKTDEMEIEKVSNEIINISGRPKLIAKQTSNRDKYVNAGEEIEYYIEIENQGQGYAKQLVLTDYLPSGLKYIDAVCELRYNTVKASKSGDNYVMKFDLGIGEKALITVTAKAMPQSQGEVEITNKVSITGNNTEDIQPNSITHTLKTNPDALTSGTNNNTSVHTVSGTAWEDKNKDAKKDAGESRISDLEVILVHSETGQIARKTSSGEEQILKTNSDGEYTFTEVENGKYIVLFLYDSARYTLTESNKEGLSTEEDSDAVKSQVKYNNNLIVAGVTNTISIENNRITGVNIGLIKINTNEFSLDKVVTKTIMENKKTSKTVNLDKSKLAKIDVDGKYINNTNLVIEYKIMVTNTGSVEGYVKTITDYVPNELKFSADLNKDWYLGKDGQIYNTSLSNVLIKPGETKEVTLILTKKMTENDSGIVHNTAKIQEIYNEYGVENIINQDNSKITADVIIAIKTGKAVTYIILCIIIFLVLGIGAYYINKKVLAK